MKAYIEWLGSRVVDRRRTSDPLWVSRALRLSAGSIARMPVDDLKKLFQARLAVVPFIEAAFSKDESIRSELSVPLERIRYISHDAIVAEDAFLESIVSAFRYKEAKLRDRLGRTYDVRAVGIINDEDGHYESVIFVRDDNWVFIEKGRLFPILVADLNGLLQHFIAHRQTLGLTEHEANVAAHEMVDMPPTARLARLDEIQSRAPLQFYRALNIRIGTGEALRPTDLLQQNVDLLRPLLESASPGWTEELLARQSWESTFQVASSLPCRLDNVLFASVPDAVRDDPESFVGWASSHGAPGAFHACDVLLSDAAFDRSIAERIFRKTLCQQMLEWRNVQLKLDLTRWFLGEILRQPDTNAWSASERLSAPWIQSGLISNVLASCGYDVEEMLEPLQTLPQLDMFLLLDESEVRQPSNALQVNAHDLILCASHDLIAKHRIRLDSDTTAILRAFLVEGVDKLPPMYGWPAAILTQDSSDNDPIGSYLSGSRFPKIVSLIGELGAEFHWRDPKSDEVIRQVQTELAKGNNETDWRFVSAVILGSTMAVAGASDLLMRAIAEKDVAAELRSTDERAWRMRLSALTQTARILKPNDFDAYDEFFKLSANLVLKDEHANTADAASLIDIFSITVRASPEDVRVARLANALNYLSTGSTDFARGIGATASILRDRLPGASVSQDIASSILKCRAII